MKKIVNKGNVIQNKYTESNKGFLRAFSAQNNEIGRSMTEMLGVLAIVGILSVGGVVMYRTAMNKHRANELLNEASKRATVVAMQYAEGKTTGSITEFDNNDMGYAKFKTDAITFTNGTFSLAFDLKPDKNVCDQMIDIAGENSIMQIAEDCSEITFNADLTIGNGETKNEKTGGGECTKTCSGGQACINGYCQCPQGSIWNPSDNSGNGACVSGITGCTSNAECGEGKFCEIRSSTYDSNAPDTGNCLDIGTITEIKFNGNTFLTSVNYYPNWWTARNWCQANGRSMVGLSDLEITGGYQSGMCGKWSTDNCIGADWEKLQPLGQVWTKNFNSSPNNPFYLDVYNKGVDSNYGRWDVAAKVLCK